MCLYMLANSRRLCVNVCAHVYLYVLAKSRGLCVCVCVYVCLYVFANSRRLIHDYGLATCIRLLQMIGLFCKRVLWKRRYSAKETYNFNEPTNRSHHIHVSLTKTLQISMPSMRVCERERERVCVYVCVFVCVCVHWPTRRFVVTAWPTRVVKLVTTGVSSGNVARCL